ncbi:MAG: hypothetical protein ABI378_05750, partial [Chitinophagaceae bacterium]
RNRIFYPQIQDENRRNRKAINSKKLPPKEGWSNWYSSVFLHKGGLGLANSSPLSKTKTMQVWACERNIIDEK